MARFYDEPMRQKLGCYVLRKNSWISSRDLPEVYFFLKKKKERKVNEYMYCIKIQVTYLWHQFN
jgi:hypothetical protein